ncbi:VOC family protein [Gammaproteobacteria bacterium]|nr:VOC family protein [Gammaproteobacteria bacterium]
MKLEFHHINFVSKDVDEMNKFYTNILGMDQVPLENFPRSEKTADSGYNGKINFVTEGKIEMHLAERDFQVGFRNKQAINPVARGHIAFRTNDINEFIIRLKVEGIPYSDYGSAFAKEWHQIFFHDPEGNVIEVHQKIDS